MTGLTREGINVLTSCARFFKILMMMIFSPWTFRNRRCSERAQSTSKFPSTSCKTKCSCRRFSSHARTTDHSPLALLWLPREGYFHVSPHQNLVYLSRHNNKNIHPGDQICNLVQKCKKNLKLFFLHVIIMWCIKKYGLSHSDRNVAKWILVRKVLLCYFYEIAVKKFLELSIIKNRTAQQKTVLTSTKAL